MGADTDPDAQPAADRVADEPFHVMTKPHGALCNLDCEYCYYLGKRDLYPDADDFRMDSDTLESFVRQYIRAQPGPVVNFAWQGGEPTLLGIDFFREVVRLQEKHAPPDTRVVNALQTNGTRIDAEWARFLADEEFLVGVSIDGPAPLHDHYRVAGDGSGSHADAVAGLELLREHGVEHNVLCVVSDVVAAYPLEVARYFRDLGVEWVQYIPLVETDPDPGGALDRGADADPRVPELGEPTEPPTYEWVERRAGPLEQPAVEQRAREADVSARSVGARAYGEFLTAVFDEWVREDAGQRSVQLFDQVLARALGGEADLCVFQETCGRQLAVEHNGDLYACDHFVEPGHRLGNLTETPLADLVDSREQQSFGAYKREGLPGRCRSCDVREFCHGGCPKNRVLETPDGEFGLNYLCPAYRRFFRYVEPYLALVESVADRGMPLTAIRSRVRALDDRFAG